MGAVFFQMPGIRHSETHWSLWVKELLGELLADANYDGV
jgi:hypothetical protein